MHAPTPPVVVGVLALSWLALLAGCNAPPKPTTESAVANSTLLPADAADLGLDAYLYGYPLVTMEMTRRVMTDVATPTGVRAPMGQFARVREYPLPTDRQVTAPNADTLYTLAWLDVGQEPAIVSVPDAQGRYYLMPLLDGWTNVIASPGTRTTGTGPQTFAVTGPGWSGTLPAGVAEHRSPTSMVWLLGRIYCTGTPQDYAAVHAMQDRCTIVPLSAYGRPYTPPAGVVDPAIDGRTPVRDQVNALGAQEYFTLLAQLLVANPPAPEDARMMGKLKALGITPGEPFDMSAMVPQAADALNSVPRRAWEKMAVHMTSAGTLQDGWSFSTRTGQYGSDYLQRATIAAFGLGANLPQDAVYPTSQVDADGKPYSGANRYVMHFNKGQMPPAEAFWSLTMYDASYFLVPNPLNRYTLSSRDTFVTNPDGSVDFFIQHTSPGKEKEANWLPAPPGRFVLMLRLYWPSGKSPSIIDGTWQVPGVRRVQ